MLPSVSSVSPARRFRAWRNPLVRVSNMDGPRGPGSYHTLGYRVDARAGWFASLKGGFDGTRDPPRAPFFRRHRGRSAAPLRPPLPFRWAHLPAAAPVAGAPPLGRRRPARRAGSRGLRTIGAPPA